MDNFDLLKSAGIDIDAFIKRLMGNTSLVRIFIGKFVQDQNYAQLVEAFAENDMTKAEHASHTLKGMCGNLSLDALYKLFTKQTNLIRAGKYSEASEMMPEISALYEHARTDMCAWLNAD